MKIKKNEGCNLHIDSFFFARFLVNRMHQKVRVRFLRIQLYPNQPTLSSKITFFRPRG